MPAGYTHLQHIIRLLPVNDKDPENRTGIISERIRLSPASKSSRALRWGGVWQEGFLQDQATYHFAADLPPMLAAIQPEKISVDLSLFESTGTVRVDVAIIPLAQARRGEKAISTTRLIQPTSRNGSKFVFDNLGNEQIVDPITGRFYLHCRISNTQTATDDTPVFSQRMPTKWRINDFRVELTGSHMPGKTEPKRF
jgi:hypothetical protein